MSDEATEAIPIGQGDPQPVVFMSQPTEYEVLTGARLQEWEDVLAERVGLRGLSLARKDTQSRMSHCISWSGKGGLDDCDMVEM
jgi:hypothetical protein